jgi:endonuclease I
MYLLIFVALTAKAQIPTGYYSNADGLSGEVLKATLHDIIKDHHELSYDSVTIALRVTDQDTIDTSKLICFYTGWTYGKLDFGNGSEEWNREHVWSKSHGDFGNNPPSGTDLFQLHPADASVNSSKSNRDFDWGITQYIDGSGPTDCYKDTDIWEPRDEVKGDVARIIFYMATRYEGDNGELDLEPLDSVNTAVNNEPHYGKLSTLISWHQNDPVDEWERKRNDTIYYHYQHNRNPFIDHPEYVDSIWGAGIIGEPSNHVTDFVSTATSTSITNNWTNNDGDTLAQGYLIMINKTGIFTSPVDSTGYPNDVDLSDGEGIYNVSHNAESYTWENLSPETEYYFKIFPFSNSGESINYKTDGIVPQTNNTTDTLVFQPVLIISEVTHPSDKSTAKYVEVTNIGNDEMDFSSETWYLSIQSNGGSTWRDVQLTGSLKPDSSITLAYSATVFNTWYGKNTDIASGNISGNGNDGYFLYSGGKHSTGTLMDAYGVIDENGSGTEWEYTNSRAYRIYSVTAPDTIWNTSEWMIEPATTSQMTPKWHHRILTWNGSASSDINDNNNWNESGLTIPDYKADASCKLNIANNGIAPVITENKTFSIIEMEAGATLTISNNATLEIIGK